MKARILLLHTGGTFGMEFGRDDEARLASHAHTPEYLDALTRRVPELASLAEIETRVLCNLDSTDMGPPQWKRLAESIVAHWDSFDGFVIVHGTDTMAYTACALAFFLAGLTKPVVLTGSQRPLSELRTDARANLIDAVELASSGIPEVLVCFDGSAHRGTRATKHSNEHLHAFRSPNAAPLGHFGVHFRIRKRLARKPLPALARTRPALDARIDAAVACLDALPGCTLPEGLAGALLSTCKGIVLKGFGAGNLPLLQSGWLALCEAAQAARVPVVMASQCPAGMISLDAYENGRVFRDRGVVPAHDMTFEATTLKLMVMLGRGVPFERRHEFFATPIALEMNHEEP